MRISPIRVAIARLTLAVASRDRQYIQDEVEALTTEISPDAFVDYLLEFEKSEVFKQLKQQGVVSGSKEMVAHSLAAECDPCSEAKQAKPVLSKQDKRSPSDDQKDVTMQTTFTKVNNPKILPLRPQPASGFHYHLGCIVATADGDMARTIELAPPNGSVLEVAGFLSRNEPRQVVINSIEYGSITPPLVKEVDASLFNGGSNYYPLGDIRICNSCPLVVTFSRFAGFTKDSKDEQWLDLIVVGDLVDPTKVPSHGGRTEANRRRAVLQLFAEFLSRLAEI